MEEQLKQINEALEKAYEALDLLKPGSEEYSRLWDSIKGMEVVRTDLLETISDSEVKVRQNKLTVANLIITGVGMVFVPLFGIFMQRKTNVDLMEYEKDDVMTSKGYDNNPLKLLFKTKI